MNKRITPTLALIIAGGLAAGIGLARPSASTSAAAGSGGYGSEATTQQTSDTGYGYGSGYGQAPGPTTTPAPAAPAATATNLVIKDFAFSSGAVEASGQPVSVTNDDSAAHTLTFDSGEVDTGTLGLGESATFTAPTAPGTYTFFCSIHPSMQGQLEVQG